MSVTLTGERRDPSVARTYARHILQSIDGAAADDALIVVSELVTNAVLHACDPIIVTVTLDLPEVIISVTDSGAREPTYRHPAEHDESGRGLEVIQGLATHWRVEHTGATKSVVAVVNAAPGPPVH